MKESRYALVSWDYVMFAGLFIVSTGIGLFFAFRDRKRTRNADDYLMGGRMMHAIPVALSMTSGFVSSITIIGIPSEVYIFGTMILYMCCAHFIMAIVSAEIYIPLFYRLNITSTNEYLEMRFNRPVRMLATTVFIANQIMYIGIVIYAPALALNQVAGLDLWTSVLLAGGVCTFYTTLGGLKAVVWTDVFQVCVMCIGFIAILARASSLMGGFSNIWTIASKGGRIDFVHFETDPRIRHTFWSTVIGFSFFWTGNYGTTQTVVQRFLCCKTEKHAKTAVYLNSIGMALITSLAGLSGIAMYAYYSRCDPITAGWVKANDQMAPYFVMEILHDYPGLPGIYLCSAFSGTLSTVSSGITAMATVALEDFIKPYKKISPLASVWISKALVLFFGCACLAMVGLAMNLGSIVGAALSLSGILLGPMLGLFTMGWGCPWVNSKGALVGSICGIFLTSWCYIGKNTYGIPNKFVRKLDLITVDCEFGNSSFTPTTISSTGLLHESTTQMSTVVPEQRPAIAEFYSLSYTYYPLLGFLVALLIGSLVSFLTGRQKPDEIAPGLTIAFFDHPVFRWIPEKIRKPLRFGVTRDVDTKSSNSTAQQELLFVAKISDENQVKVRKENPINTKQDKDSENKLLQNTNT